MTNTGYGDLAVGALALVVQAESLLELYEPGFSVTLGARSGLQSKAREQRPQGFTKLVTQPAEVEGMLPV